MIKTAIKRKISLLKHEKVLADQDLHYSTPGTIFYAGRNFERAWIMFKIELLKSLLGKESSK